MVALGRRSRSARGTGPGIRSTRSPATLAGCASKSFPAARRRRHRPGRRFPAPGAKSRRIRVALGLAEGCVVLPRRASPASRRARAGPIGCASCHAATGGTRDKDARACRHGPRARQPRRRGAHLRPGRLPRGHRAARRALDHDDHGRRDRGQPRRCSASRPARRPLPHAQRLGHGVADSHLRELCVGCHLGQAKSGVGTHRRGVAGRRLQRLPPRVRRRGRESGGRLREDAAGGAQGDPRAHPSLTREPAQRATASAATAAPGASR